MYSIFVYNSTLIGKPKHITIKKDGVIQSYFFEDEIGAIIEIKHIDAVYKTLIIEKYKTQKSAKFQNSVLSVCWVVFQEVCPEKVFRPLSFANISIYLLTHRQACLPMGIFIRPGTDSCQDRF